MFIKLAQLRADNEQDCIDIIKVLEKAGYTVVKEYESCAETHYTIAAEDD